MKTDDLLLWGSAAVMVGLAALQARSVAGGRIGRHPFPQPVSRGVPLARGGSPVWPLHHSSLHGRLYDVSYKDAAGKWHGRAARSFKWTRPNGRYHVGMDLFANPGDVVVAPEDGVVIGKQTFMLGTGAMMLQLDSGLFVLLGETEMGGANEFGIKVGSRVKRGQPITRVGLSTVGSHMLHVETYSCCPKTNIRWYRDQARPSEILDPTDWMLRAKAASVAVA